MWFWWVSAAAFGCTNMHKCTNKLFCFVYSAECSAVKLCRELKFLSMVSEAMLPFLLLWHFHWDSGGARESSEASTSFSSRGSLPSASSPAVDTLCRLTSVGWAETTPRCVWLMHALEEYTCSTNTHTECLLVQKTYTHCLVFCLCHVHCRVVRVSGLAERVRGAIRSCCRGAVIIIRCGVWFYDSREITGGI